MYNESPIQKHPISLNEVIFLFTADSAHFDVFLKTLDVWTNNAKLSIQCRVSLPPNEFQYLALARKKIRDKGYACTVFNIPYGEYVDRWAKGIYHASIAKYKWIIFADGDSMFFIWNLISFLGQYDSNQIHVFGAITENFGNLQYHGTLAYGGGGIVLSRKLGMQIQGLGEKRMDPYMNILYGDQILCAMLREMNIPITIVSTMNQLDLSGDISGLIEGGKLHSNTISIHHYGIFSILI